MTGLKTSGSCPELLSIFPHAWTQPERASISQSHMCVGEPWVKERILWFIDDNGRKDERVARPPFLFFLSLAINGRFLSFSLPHLAPGSVPFRSSQLFAQCVRTSIWIWIRTVHAGHVPSWDCWHGRFKFGNASLFKYSFCSFSWRSTVYFKQPVLEWQRFY